MKSKITPLLCAALIFLASFPPQPAAGQRLARFDERDFLTGETQPPQRAGLLYLLNLQWLSNEMAGHLSGRRPLPDAPAADFIWNLNGDGLWRLNGNWDQTGFPDNSVDNAFIRNTTAPANGVVVTLAGSTNVNNVTIDDSGAPADQNTLVIANNTFLNVSGNITNNGVISLQSTGSVTQLRLDGSDLTLSGSGILNLGSHANNSIRNATGTNTLFNTATHTIAGGGNIGGNNIGINNAGMINANLNAVTMTIDPSSTLGLSNTGTMQASNGGILLLTGSAGGSFTNTSGTIQALNGSEVQLTADASITGGTFTTAGTGVIRVNTSQNVFFTDITNNGAMIGSNNSDFGIAGMINNAGTIDIVSTGSATDLEIQTGGVTLTGGGTITLSGGSFAGIDGAIGERLTNVNNIIQGQGRIGQNSIAVTNQAGGLIHANVNGATLTLDPVADANVVDSGPAFLNDGTLRASNGGILLLTGSGAGAFTNNGLIQAFNGSEVQLTSSASVTGGTFTTVGTGVIRVNSSQNVFFTGITNNGAMIGDNNSDFGISGLITNKGTISIVSTGSATSLEVQAGGATLTGTGLVTLSGSAAQIDGSGTLTQTASHTIAGAGNIGANALGIVNAGLIDANSGGNILTLDPSNALGLTNTGTLQASGGGFLLFTGGGGGAFTNTGALIQALDGSEVRFASGASITGGTLATFGSGILRVNAVQDAFFTGLTNAGTLIGDNGSDIFISGTINNTGSIEMASTGSATDLKIVAGGATLTGGGTVTLSGSNNVFINSTTTGTRLTNVNNTIQGRGNFGQNALVFTNQAGGLVDANVAGATLMIDPAANAIDLGASFLNDGILQASNGGILAFTGNAGGAFTNNGTIQALNASEVQFLGNANITGGTLATFGSGVLRVIAVQNAFFTSLTKTRAR